LLIAVHIYLVRKHGVAPLPGDEVRPRKKFYPEQAFKDTLAIFVTFVILFVMALVVRVPLERLADPTDTTYIPRPEWYFLFLFQSLKFFEGSLEVFASVILPALAVLALLLVPFIDRGRAKRVTQRTGALAVIALAGLGWASLTAAAVFSTPKPDQAALVDFSQPTDWMQLTPVELAGIGHFREQNCDACHSVGEGKTLEGPDLAGSGIHKSAGWMIQHFKRPAAMVPGSSMPTIRLEDAQLNMLAAFLLKLTPQNAEALRSAPDFVVQGALIYQTKSCGTCHIVNKQGTKLGPTLNGLRRRRSRAWVEQHFRNPQAMSPGTVMPPYKLSPTEMENLCSYLFTLSD
jgi:ubiquinol-cytochrome c reductase cytochrome b subunit